MGNPNAGIGVGSSQNDGPALFPTLIEEAAQVLRYFYRRVLTTAEIPETCRAIREACETIKTELPRIAEAMEVETAMVAGMHGLIDEADSDEKELIENEEKESRWCPECQKYRGTVYDVCEECGSET